MNESFFDKDDREVNDSRIPNLDDSNDTFEGSGNDKDRAVIAAVLSYIPFLCLIPLLQMQDSEAARFHSRQGLILFLIELLALLFLIPGLSSLFWKTIIIVALGASVAGIIFGIQGKSYSLPFIGDWAKKLKF